MRDTVLLLALLAALVVPLGARASQPALPQPPSGEQSEGVRRGVGHFDKAFYDLTPHKRDLEAAQEYDSAIAAFENELAVRPASATAHAYLARIYYLRQQFDRAAAHYDRLTELDPENIDAYVLAALAYTEAGNIGEARTRLETAKHHTTDPGAVRRLDEYLAKLQTATP